MNYEAVKIFDCTDKARQASFMATPLEIVIFCFYSVFYATTAYDYYQFLTFCLYILYKQSIYALLHYHTYALLAKLNEGI
jgi:hypothetical protein